MEELSVEGMELLKSFGPMALDFAVTLLQALFILILGLWLAGWSARAVRKTIDRSKRVENTVRPILANLVRYTVIIVTGVIILGQFGVETTSIIAVLGAAGLAIGLALQGTLQNIAAGIMILALRPFKVGEFVNAGGVSGTVEEVGLFNTQLTTFDGIFVAVPNSQLWNAAVTNYSRNSSRRLDLTVGISYSDDIATALTVLREIAEQDERVLKDPEPQVLVHELTDSAVNIQLRCWIGTDDFWMVKWDLNRLSKERIEAAGCTIPFPQRDVHHHNAGGGEAA